MDYIGLETSAALTVTAVIVTSLYVWKLQHVQCNYPPGPFTFPLLGNIPQMIWCGSLQGFLDRNRHTYGNIFTIEFGGTKQVVVCGYDNIDDLMVKKADYSSNRSLNGMPAVIRRLVTKSPGLFWSPPPHWKTLRTFALNVLRDEGKGSQSLEESILLEADEYCKFFIDPKLGHEITFSTSLAKATNNVISELVFGGRSAYEDPLLSELVDAVDRSTKSLLRASIVKNIPIIKHSKLSGSNEQERMLKTLLPTLNSKLNKHKETIDADNQEDIFYEYLMYKNKQGSSEAHFEDGNVVMMALDLYIAGTESTSTALQWALLYTCLNPEVQSKVKKELDDVIGVDRSVKYSDRNELPYTSAVLQETLRLANIVPTGLPRAIERELELDGKVIPSGSLLILDMASVLHDEEVFPYPKKFDPDRYLTGDIKLKKQRTIPFGLGRRVCLGEKLARMEFFLFYTTLMQRYDVKLAGGRVHSTSPIESITNSPQPYNITFTKRA